MDVVTIKLECSPEAAATLVPLLVRARLLTYENKSKWCAFFADGEGKFRIGDISVENDMGPIDVDLDSSLWESSAVLNYEIDGQSYEHIEQEVVLSDAGE